jgi:hypothetical protein
VSLKKAAGNWLLAAGRKQAAIKLPDIKCYRLLANGFWKKQAANILPDIKCCWLLAAGYWQKASSQKPEAGSHYITRK